MKMKDLINNEDLKLKANRQLPFTVPNGYFEMLPERIQDFCTKPQQQKPYMVFLQTVRTQLALAAGFAALVVLGYAGYFYIQRPEAPTQNLTNNDYIEIVSKRISDYDETQLVDAGGINTNIDTLKHNKSDQMIQYLLEDNIDYVTLMEQLNH
jgi:hypothetical protein